jgi:hypothetical protein
MKRFLLLALAFPLPSLAAAQTPPPVETCGAADAALPANFAPWRSPTPAAGTLHPGTAVQVMLRPIAELQAAVPPHSARDGGATTGARLDLEIAAAGSYEILVDHAAWIDLVQGGTALRSTAHAQALPCTSVHKVVDFSLSPGRYVIQVSGTTAASARLLVVPR